MARGVQTCPKCRALLEPGTKTCPYCEADQRWVGARGPEADARATTRMGVWLLGAIAVVYFLSVQLDPVPPEQPFRPSGESLVAFGSSDPGLIRDCGQYWRLVTANFLHLDVVHLLFNAIAIFYLIPLAAITFGAHRTLCVFFFAGACGFMLSQAQGIKAVGASAALCGLISALAVYGRRRGSPELTRRMLVWGVLILAIGFLFATSRDLPQIDNWGHGGGFLGGALLAWPAAAVRARGSRADRLWQGGAYLCVALCAIVVATCQIPSIVRGMERRDVVVYWSAAKRALKQMHEASAGNAKAKRALPETFEEGPADSGAMAAAIRTALEETKRAPDSPEARASQTEAYAAFYRWQESLGCSHYIFFELVPR